MRTGVDFDAVEVGTSLDGFTTPALTRTMLARFAGAIDVYDPVHLDDAVAKATGRASVYAPGALVMAWIGRMVQQWVADATLRTYGLRMTKLLWPGDVMTCRGTVRDKSDAGEQWSVAVDVRADNQRGEMVATGRFIAVAPKGGRRATASSERGLTLPSATQTRR